MRVVRFMTEVEKELYLSGARIVNGNQHNGRRSTCMGACFAELTPARDADKWLRKLAFVRPCEWVVEFETDDFHSNQLNEGTAVYASDNPAEWGKQGTVITVREWWTVYYSLQTHPYRRLGRCPSVDGLCRGQRIEWQ